MPFHYATTNDMNGNKKQTMRIIFLLLKLLNVFLKTILTIDLLKMEIGIE